MLVVVSTESMSSEKRFVAMNHVQIVGKSNSSLDGRVISCAVQIHSQPKVSFLPILGLEFRNAGPCLFTHL